MIKRLYFSIFFIISFVTLVLFGNQIVILQFIKSSNILLFEFDELYAIQNYKSSLLKLNTITYLLKNNPDYTEDLSAALVNLNDQHQNFKREVSHIHLEKKLKPVEDYYQTINTNIVDVVNSGYNHEKVNLIIRNSSEFTSLLNKMIHETKEEILEAEQRNTVIKKHGTITLVSVGIFFIFLLTLVSINLAKRITIPIKTLLQTTKRISAGNRDIRVNLKTKDEFQELASSFNYMLDKLNKTTLSLDYVNNILDNIYGALFVTNKRGEIESSNKVALELLHYNTDELTEKHISSLFEQKNSDDGPIDLRKYDTYTLGKQLNNLQYIKNKEGKCIPVIVNSTLLTNKGYEGLIVVVHDITEKHAYEAELTKIRKENLIAIQDAQESERSVIATDLHDSLGQKLSAISFLLQSLCGPDKKESSDVIYLKELTNSAIKETRHISHSLMPSVLQDFGLLVALKDLISTTNNVQDIKFTFTHYNWDKTIDKKLEKALYRVCQEALNNILKHSQAQCASFQLFQSKDMLTLMIDDDGIGFKNDTKIYNQKRGIGLFGMKERISAFDGDIIINTMPNKGTELIIEVPFKN